jgi:hypothetical protein
VGSPESPRPSEQEYNRGKATLRQEASDILVQHGQTDSVQGPWAGGYQRYVELINGHSREQLHSVETPVADLAGAIRPRRKASQNCLHVDVAGGWRHLTVLCYSRR